MYKALKEGKVNPNYLVIEEFNENHVGLIHDYLLKFSNKTYNDKMSTYRSFFNYLIKEGHKVNNVFAEVKMKRTEARTDIISIEDFKRLCEVATEENGWSIINKGHSKQGRRQLYRDYLVDIWRFALFSGCRPEEIRNVKDIKEDYILVKNYKVSRSKNEDVFRYVVLIKELHDLVKELIEKNQLAEEDYLLADEETNRVNMMNVCSLAFSHYWKLISDERRIFYDLRNTYATRMIEKIGNRFEGVTGLHSNIRTTSVNYLNTDKILSSIRRTQLFDANKEVI